jgi:Cys-rich repeat protein
MLSGTLLVTFSNEGCGGDDKTQVEPTNKSRKGEACQVTNDCASGLACQPIAVSSGGSVGICVVGQFNVSQTAKECALIDCKTADDCCPTPPTNCASLLTQCLADAGFSSQQACTQYDSLCKCDTTKRDCENDKCVVRCNSDVDCVTSSTGPRCGGGKCVQCASDGDCASGSTCLNGKCQAPCTNDGDCAGFSRCVTGQCIDSGCQTDRECIAATRNVEATCGTDGKCIVPCQTDLECGNPKAYSFFSCLNNQCVYMGCQTEKDCRLFLTGASDASTLGPKQHVECRDKQAPGNTTTPAK